MKWILLASDYMIPLTILYIVGFAVLMRRPVYDDFVEGAKEGASTVFGILPTLVGLMVGVGALRASGFLDAVTRVLGPIAGWIGFPTALLPVALVRLFSSSAATGLVLDIFRQYGPDSELGMITSVMMSCTETVFYTMSVYFMTAGVRKTRYTLAGALLAAATGIAASVLIVRWA